MAIITKADAQKHLRLIVIGGQSPDDPWLDLWIPIVEAAVEAWLKDSWRLYLPELDGNGNPVLDDEGNPVPSTEYNPIVKGAVLVELASQFRFREGDGAATVPSHWGYGFTLGAAATSLLTPLRRPTVA